MVKSLGSGFNGSEFRCRFSNYRLHDPRQVTMLLLASVSFLINTNNNSTYLLYRSLLMIKFFFCLVLSKFTIILTIICSKSYNYRGEANIRNVSKKKWL